MSYQSICRYAVIFTLLFSLSVISGCKEKPKIKETSGQTTPKKPKPLASLKGNWLLSVVEHRPGENRGEFRSVSIPVVLLNFEPKDPTSDAQGKETVFKTTLLDTTNLTGTRTLTSAEVVGDNIHIVLGGDEKIGPMDFQATFNKGVVRGSAMLVKQGGGCIVSRLLPVGKLTKLPPNAKENAVFQNEGKALNEQLQHAGNNPQLIYQTLYKNAEQNPQRAFSLFLYEYRLLSIAIGMRLPEEKFDDLYKNYMKSAAFWGLRYQKFARISMASTIAQSGYLPQVAIRHFDESEKTLSKEEGKQWKELVTSMRNVARGQKEKLEEVARIGELIKKLQAEDKKLQQEGEKGIKEVLAKQSFMPPLLQEMADYYERQGQFDKAIKFNAELTVLPKASQSLSRMWRAQNVKHELPQTILTRLWKKKHGNVDKLDEYLTETYEKLLATIPGKKFTRSGKDAGNHIVLCELFTGSRCSPCTAADVASGALETTFAPSELIMLRYHQHIPGADPLANADNYKRLRYYQVRGTPAFCVDGKKLSTLAGHFLHNAKPIYDELVKVVQPLLSAKTKVKIALSATGNGKTLHLSASVTGLKNPPKTLRLRLVLAEERIPFVAGNGIRIHEMIVRKMPGGIEGTPFKDGKMEYSTEISLAEFKTDLIEQLEAIEEQNDMNVFPIIPISLQKLQLIGIVQDDEDGTVLQSAIIPVSGKLIYPKTKVAPETIPTKEAAPKQEKEDSKNNKESAFSPLPRGLEKVLFEESDKETKEDNPQEKSKKKKKEVIRRETVEGNWILEIYPQRGTGFPIVLLQIKKLQPLKHELKLVDFVERIGKMQLESSRLEKTFTTFVIDGNIGKLSFEGSLSNNNIVGAVQFKSGIVVPAMLHPVSQEKFGKAATKLRRDKNVTKFLEKLRETEEGKKFQAYRQFVKDHPHSPFAMIVYSDVLFMNVGRAGLSVEETTLLAKEYMKQAAYWGPQMEQHARLGVADALISQKFAPQIARTYLDEAIKNIKPKAFVDWNLLIKPSLTKLEMVAALIDIRSSEKKVQKKAFDFLSNIQEIEPFNHQVIWALAQHAEQQENNKEAMRLYAQLSSLPSMQRMLRRDWAQEDFAVQPKLPSDDLARLWKRKYGTTDLLDKYLDHVYEKALEAIPGEKHQGRKVNAKNHVVLCELFTGSKCPPCVGADLSTAALQKTFAPTELIVLRYHQHVPGPDPFANTQSSNRFSYYNGRGTPSVYLDGKSFRQAGGYLQNAKETYDLLRPLVEKKLDKKSDMSISVSAKVADGQMKLTANVTGLPKDKTPLRLRLVLAEDRVNYVAGNGIRLHEMIVRQMPGGVDGVKVKEEKLQYEENFALADFKKGLLDDLESFENKNRYQFRAMPLALEKIHFVAFVQNDHSGKVLQSAMVSIKEKLKYPKPLPKKDEKKSIDKKEKK